MNPKDCLTKLVELKKEQQNMKDLLFDFWPKHNSDAKHWPHLKMLSNTLHLVPWQFWPAEESKFNPKWNWDNATFRQFMFNYYWVPWCISWRHFPLYDSEINFLHKIGKAKLFMKAYSLNCCIWKCTFFLWFIKSKRQGKFIFVK